MIVVAGEALVDLVVGRDGSVHSALGGGPFNVSRTIARLGGDASFLGSISTDRFGTELFSRLVSDGVATDLVSRSDAPTTLALAELDEDGAATYQFYLAETSASTFAAVPEMSGRVDAVHVGTLGLVVEPMSSVIEAFVGSLSDDTLVMVDPNCRPAAITNRDAYLTRIERVVRCADVVKISTDDAAYLAPDLAPDRLAESMVTAGVGAVLLTAGGGDTVVVTAQGSRRVPIVPVSVVDTIGAGDSFGGAFLRAWTHAGRSVSALGDLDAVAECAAAANEAAASTCTRPGADPPRLDQLPAGWGGSR